MRGKQILAYTAGIIDGEGCILIDQAKNKRYKAGYRNELRVRVGNNSEWLCRWLKMQFGGHIAYHAQEHYWIWGVGTKQAASFLETILPYLQLKRYQAEIAIEFQKGKYRGRPHKDKGKELAVEEAEKILLVKDHHRGGDNHA